VDGCEIDRLGTGAVGDNVRLPLSFYWLRDLAYLAPCTTTVTMIEADAEF